MRRGAAGSILSFLIVTLTFLGAPTHAWSGSVFVSGHDAIWHSNFGGNSVGARNLALTAIAFARDGSPLPFLFVESTSVPVPGGNAREAPFLISRLGFTAADFVVADAAMLNGFADFRAELDGFSAIVIASDHGGMLTAAELQFLNAHVDDIIDYLNAGGGLAAFAESNARGLIGATQRFGFLPFVVSSVDLQSAEVGNPVTPFGASLGLVNSDVNGNFSHNIFSATGGMQQVDLRNGDPAQILSLAFRGPVGPCGVGILQPELAFNPVGAQHDLSATVTDNFDVPLSGVEVTFDVVAGPNAGDSGMDVTNAAGEATFSYTGDGGSGVDDLVATYLDEAGELCESNPALKFWDGDCQPNDVPDTCDISCDAFDGLCAEFSGCGGSADADGDGVPDECNMPPTCTGAFADPTQLWPPNHKFRDVAVVGVTDPDGDPVVLTITSIFQDEPLNGLGDGNTCPDGSGVGTDTATVRAERSGTRGVPGDGRVYHIGLRADDGHGGSCEGTVSVCVPHDQGMGVDCVDQGPLFDSTRCP
jgi:hypothetical protein